ncbi:Ger(x)C family spore germination protein [Haloimpatiens sp. FM7330]|uniref:Ger(x)C family spore germination protein n=1 Tax=Haloimpatiens sp. FM7330 TaxID=3298610 RepID=UPI0036440A49
MIKKSSKLSLICLMIIPLFLTGCWDYEDVDKKSIVITLGVDRVNDDIEFSTEIAKLGNQANGGKPEAKNVYTDVAYGKNFEQARVDFNVRRPYPTFLAASRAVVFGEKYAKEGIQPYLHRINRMYDYRKTVLAVVCRGNPKELFETKVENDLSVGFLIEHNIHFLSNKGTAIYKNIGQMLSDISLGDVGYVMPYIGKEGKSIKYLGLAVMKDSKLIDVINVGESDGLLYLLAKEPRLVEVVGRDEDNKNLMSFGVKIKKRKIKTNYINGKPVININLDLSTQLRYQYYIESLSDKDIKELEFLISQKVKKDITTLIDKSQKKYKCDIFGFARYFRADNSQNYSKINWQKEYPHAEINVNVNTKIINKNLKDPNAKLKNKE